MIPASVMTHLPALQIIIPLMAAPISLLLWRPALAAGLTFCVTLTCLAISALLLSQVIDGTVISYHLGGWSPPWGIEYRIDAANAFVLLIVSAIGAVVSPYAWRSAKSEIEPDLLIYFYICFLLCFTGLLGVTITGDAFNVFVFLEISSLSTYALVAMGAGRDRRALTASYNYLIMGTIGATFFVIGIGFIYMATGTLNMMDLAKLIAANTDSRTIRVGFVFIVVGMGLKIAMFPLHLWLPNAYTYAPSVVTSFLAATATKVAVYVLIRFIFTIFGVTYYFGPLTLDTVIMPLAILAMFAASIVAIFQEDLKRMLAYSSIAQIGYMLLGISMVSKTGLVAAIIHLFNHALTKGALFMAVGCFIYRIGSSRISALRGIGREMPFSTAAFGIAGLSLIGVPLTAGFISKWYLVQASFESGDWWIAGLIVLSSLLAVIYVWRFIETAYLRPTPARNEPVKEVPASMAIPTWILVAATLFFGINAEMTSQAAITAANLLMAPQGSVVP